MGQRQINYRKEFMHIISSDGLMRSLKNNFTNKSFPYYCAFEMGFPEKYSITFKEKEILKKCRAKTLK